ncbi:MAG: RsmB/NOP family class I SAM-dependent RNA methyltransferase [Candidatus Methanomethylicia archaeon]|nr:RsmB/NOP family class I SAM-dependent RNA methyltransferase [Candidatus Methanomethylicia archaeon]MCX8169257.1 RsmB/NOP family class I SAM-dependent RNA methyltransferase [Candidatus Methanomethylicia archaeon]MDW7988961.1 RsmB/NOP family class I SAM-dependent RNA methyltransferase [Nitrososphaerota archaeon]
MSREDISKFANEINFPEELILYLMKFFNFERLKSIIIHLKKPPKFYSIRVNTLKTSTEKVYDSLIRLGLEVYMHPKLKEAILIGLKGPYPIEKVGKNVIVDKNAAESVYIGADLYAPGVISAKDVKRGDLVTVICETGIPVANGIAMQNENEIMDIRRGLAVKVLNSVYKCPSIRSLDEYMRGEIYEQSIPSMLTSIVLEPKPYEVIVDMCAAPGGKTTHIAQLTLDKAKIFAFDNSLSKVEKLKENVYRLNIKSVHIAHADSRYLHVDYPHLKANKVLLDPPCSALGVRPKLFERKTFKDIISCVKYQLQFFKPAVEILTKGGILVYSTCTITPDENELVVDYVLKNYPLELEEQILYLGTHGLDIITKSNMLQRFYPDEHDTPGYFIAKFVKI